MARNHFIGAIATLVGTVIGAGVLGIPYVVAQSGILIGAAHIILLGLAVILTNLYLGEVTLRTKGRHQLPGYARIYLGRKGKLAMLISMLVAIYGALIAYLIGEGASIGALFGISETVAMIIFFAVMAYLILRGLNIIEGAEIYLSSFLGIVILALMVFAAIKIDIGNFAQVDISKIFMPYGVVFFALLGMAAIPELRAELSRNSKMMKRAIIMGMLIPIFLYLVFGAIVVGATGLGTTEIATIGLGELLGKHIVVLGSIFAIVAMATSFLTLGLALKWIYQYDYNMNKYMAWILTCFVPLIIVLMKASSFVKVLGISGAVSGGLGGIIIIIMHRAAQTKSERKPEYSIKSRLWLDAMLFLVFTVGIIYTLFTI